ncbi:hypothetical protein [Serinibacter arcticus]|uniref:hypothetical protein n=1 Tax=Serinibacter arcticus TaxID=1655435 RepID=UPI0011B1D056|nr:hypothetical protein [Serinibacter arcticus]
MDLPGMVSALIGTSAGTGVAVALGASEPERVARVADVVQEWWIEELWATSPTNWPPCPEHPDSHPLQAVVAVERAVWACPTGGRVHHEIGALPAVRT